MSNYAYIRVASANRDFNSEREKLYFRKIKIDKFFTDIGGSGLSPDRKELNELLNTVKSGDKVYVKDISRLSRNTVEVFNLIGLLRDKGVNVFTTDNCNFNLYDKIFSQFFYKY